MGVRCADCGFLCSRILNKPVEGVDDAEERKTGAVRGGELALPHCYTLAFDLASEAKAVPSYDKHFLAVIQKDRECASFIEWVPGFSPREHREMLSQVEMKKLAIQEKEDDRRWEEARQLSNRRWQLFSTLLGVIVGAALSWVFSHIDKLK